MRPTSFSHPRFHAPSSLLLCAALAGCGMTSGIFVAESDAPDDAASDDRDDSPHRPMDGGTRDAATSGGGGSHVGSGEPDESDEPPARRLPCGTGDGCDPSDLGGESCESLGLGGGTLLCNTSTCTFETTLCRGLGQLAPCGTGPGCDTTNLGGATCESLGMPAGVLACNPTTCAYDTGGCIGTAGTLGGLLGGGLFGGGTTTTDEDGGTPPLFGGGGTFGTAGGGLFGGGTAGGGLFGTMGGGTAGGGTFGGVGSATPDDAR